MQLPRDTGCRLDDGMTASRTTDFALTKAGFQLPEGVTYLNGNSLGPMPLAARERVSRMMSDEWGEMLVRGWDKAGWIHGPTRIGERVGRLLGAPPGTVVMGDTSSIQLYKALAAALRLRPGRTAVISDRGNFPSDLHIAGGLIEALGRGHELRLADPEQVGDLIDESVAVLMATEVDYRTGRRHDMARLTRAAHAAGALTIWDLSHSVGAFPVDLAAAEVDFAVGCTYKFLNGGPGAPAFIYVSPRLIDRVRPALSGWLGHEAPFDFGLDYRPGPGIERMKVGTPAVLGMAALDGALDVWDGASLDDARARSVELGERFIAEVEARCPALVLASPRSARDRGSQVCFRFAHAHPLMSALIERGVIGDVRPPDILRFGIAPLYVDEEDVVRAAAIMEELVADRDGAAWRGDRPSSRHRLEVI